MGGKVALDVGWGGFWLSPLLREVFLNSPVFSLPLDCSQSPIFSWDHLDIPRLTVTAFLIFKCTEGAGVGDYSLSSFDTHARWQPVTQSSRSRWSYGKIEDCEKSTLPQTPTLPIPILCRSREQFKRILEDSDALTLHLLPGQRISVKSRWRC